MNEIANIKWEMDDKGNGWYNFEYRGQLIQKLIPDNNETPLLGNNETSKQWIYKNYARYLSVLGF